MFIIATEYSSLLCQGPSDVQSVIEFSALDNLLSWILLAFLARNLRVAPFSGTHCPPEEAESPFLVCCRSCSLVCQQGSYTLLGNLLMMETHNSIKVKYATELSDELVESHKAEPNLHF